MPVSVEFRPTVETTARSTGVAFGRFTVRLGLVSPTAEAQAGLDWNMPCPPASAMPSIARAAGFQAVSELAVAVAPALARARLLPHVSFGAIEIALPAGT